MNRISPEASVEDSPIALLYDCCAHRILTYLSRFALSEEVWSLPPTAMVIC
jgi:hypothetical protein